MQPPSVRSATRPRTCWRDAARRPRPSGRMRRPMPPHARPPRIALEKARDQQRPGEDQQGDKAQVQGRAGLPFHEVAGEARGRRHGRAGRRRGQDCAASRSGRWQISAIPAHPRSRTPRRSGRRRTRWQGRRCRQAWSLRVGWRQPKIASQIPGSGRPPARPGTRPGARSRIDYTSIPDTYPA